jgi:predicted DNA binding CopG/RHH family protein
MKRLVTSLRWDGIVTFTYAGCRKSTQTRFAQLADTGRLPDALLDRIKVEANKRDLPYQSLIKAWLAQEIEEHRGV